MAISASSTGSSVNADINVTPMADVMLVLLIIFMITAPMIAAGFSAKMPEGINLIRAEEDPEDVILGIDQSGEYYINARPVPKALAQDSLRRIFTIHHTQDRILYLKADQNLAMERIQEAVAMARVAGVRMIAAVTEQVVGTEPTVTDTRKGPEE